MPRSASLLAVIALSAAACHPQVDRGVLSRAHQARLVAAYGTASACVDSVAGVAGFGPTTISSATLAAGKWAFLLRRPAPEETGGEGHVIWLEYGLVPGRDSLRLEVTAVASYEHAPDPGRGARDDDSRVRRTSRILPSPAPLARDAVERLQASCADLPIRRGRRELPLRREAVGD